MSNEKKRRRIEGVMNKRVFSPEHEVAADLTQSGNSVARADLGHTTVIQRVVPTPTLRLEKLRN